MQVIVQSLLTHYEMYGSGKTIVIVHGWGDSMKTWHRFATDLSHGYNVVLLDLPGFGGSQAPSYDWGIGDYAEHLAAFLKKLHLKPYAIIGHSNGGAIAIKGLAHGMFSLNKLVLLASAGIRNTDATRKTALKITAKVAKVALVAIPKSAREKLKRRAYGAIGSDLYVADHLMGTFKKVVGEDIRTDATKITSPTLLLYGSADKATPTVFGTLLAEAISTSTFEIIDGADHFLQLTAREACVQRIKEFVK